MNDEQHILSLAEQYSFDTLSSVEQALVLQTMSKEEFEELHQSIQASQQFFGTQEVEISSALKPKLDQAFQMKYTKEKKLWMQRSIPIWQAAAACFLVAILSWAFLSSNTTETVTETVYVYQTDTVFQDAPIVNESPQQQAQNFVKTTPKTFPVIAKRNQKLKDEAEVVSVIFELERMPKVNDSVVVFQNRMGQSIKDDTLLMNWGGVIF